MTVLMGLLPAALAALQVWAEPSWQPVLDGERSASALTEEAKVYAARGEYEGFQLVVQGGRRGAEDVVVHCTAPHDSIPEPEIFRITYLGIESLSPRAAAEAQYWPDALVPPVPVSLERGDIALYWVRFTIPEDARPGIYRAELRVERERGRSVRMPVRVEVFDFVLPKRPEIAVVGHLDRDRLRRMTGVDDSLAAWRPFYDVLAGYGLSLSGLPGYAREAVAHGAYLLEATKVVEITPPTGRLLALEEEGRRTLLGDPLAEYLGQVAGGIAQAAAELEEAEAPDDAADPPDSPEEETETEGEGDELVVEDAETVAENGETGEGLDLRETPETPETPELDLPDTLRAVYAVEMSDRRDTWSRRFAHLDALGEASAPVQRIVAGHFHPRAVAKADAAAFGLKTYSPELSARLDLGLPLVIAPEHEALVTVSSARPPTDGQDAYDGSPWSAWRPEPAGGRRAPAWVILDLTAPVRLEKVTVLWEPGRESSAVDVEISHDGAAFASAAARWTHQQAAGPFGESRSTATLRYPSQVVSLRVLFRGSEPVGVREILLNRDDWGDGGRTGAPKGYWLQHDGEQFPSLAVDAHGAEARLLPWVAWHMGFEGALGIRLMDWPDTWDQAPAVPPLLWPAEGVESSEFLVYPGADAFYGSLRLERLRDGIEDLAYFAALEAAVADGKLEGHRAEVHAGRRVQYGTLLNRSELDGMIAYIEKARIEIGRALASVQE